MNLAEALIPLLRERFPQMKLRTGSSPDPCAVFPAIHPEVGDIAILDDGNELTIYAGNFTHGHFDCDDPQTPEPERTERTVGAVMAFLDELFADRIVLWGSHRGCGGWFAREETAETLEELREWTDGEAPKLYTWSGPLG